MWEIYGLLVMDEESRKRLAEILQKAKGERTLRQYAKDLEVSLGAVQNWISGKIFPSSEMLEKIAKSAGISLEEFFVQIRGESVKSFERPQKAEELLSLAQYLDKEQRIRLIKMLVDDVTNEKG